ncbi:NYN domain-containing protein [Brevibacterium ihuae]|uniref:NYN domain-containing protein n=1 Tax=Brevibacterium ihuae TaxID=1631743 RepID=UPI0011AF462E|nr:NYN domain-containing protein [Brevibacterium ihuae]
MSPTPSDMPQRQLQRIGFYFDYENVHKTGHDLYTEYGSPPYMTPPNPRKLADRIVRKRKIQPSVVAGVEVFRGRPNPEHQPEKASSFELLRQEWIQSGCRVTYRDLKYTHYDDGSFDSREKGIDVELAIRLVSDALEQKYDAQVLFSCDTDLLPAVELLYRLRDAHIELACWSGANRLRLKGQNGLPWCHFLTEQDFNETVSTRAGDL